MRERNHRKPSPSSDENGTIRHAFERRFHSPCMREQPHKWRYFALKNNKHKSFGVPPFEALASDEKSIFTNASDYWLRTNPDDKEGAQICARGAVIVYHSLIDSTLSDEESDEEPTEHEFLSSCMGVTAVEGSKYVSYYREARRRHSAQYATIFAGAMLINNDRDSADQCASDAELGIPSKYGNDRRFDWMRAHNPEEIRENCMRVGDGSLSPDEFTANACMECEREDCEWHPDTLADEDSTEDIIDMMYPEGGIDDGYDPDGRVTD